MLIEFSVANYRSILERQTLNMVASTYKELETLNTFIPDQDDVDVEFLTGDYRGFQFGERAVITAHRV